jgi:hypothetical protein
MPLYTSRRRPVIPWLLLAVSVQLSGSSLAPLKLLRNSSKALCMDGSPGGYYFQPASDPKHAGDWVIHLQVCSQACVCS